MSSKPSNSYYQDSSDDEEPDDEEASSEIKQMFINQMIKNSWSSIGKKEEKGEKHLLQLEKKKPQAEPFFKKSYIIKVYLCNLKPRIWRRIRVPGNITLHLLHDKVLAPVMGWVRNYHAYFFATLPRPSRSHLSTLEQKVVVYGPVQSQAVDTMHIGIHGICLADDTKVQLGQVLQKEGQKLEYVYDLGDQFRHKLLVEKIESLNEKETETIDVLDGERACPPEDCGSLFRYSEILTILNKGSSHPEFKETLYHCVHSVNYRDAHHFDPAEFSLKACKRRLMFALGSKTSPNNDENMTMFHFPFTNQATVNSPPFKENREINRVPDKKCNVCKKDSTSKCSRCHIVYYCGREHQVQDWSNHKITCSKLIGK